MATRSAIGIENKDGSVTGIYCHWDGYPSGVGAKLVNFYKTNTKIGKLLGLGDLSSLGKNIGSKHSFSNPYCYGRQVDKFDKWRAKHDDMCTAYGRDRGDIEIKAQLYENAQSFVDWLGDAGCEYFYLYRDGAWLVSDGKDDKFRAVVEVIAMEVENDSN